MKSYIFKLIYLLISVFHRLYVKVVCKHDANILKALILSTSSVL